MLIKTRKLRLVPLEIQFHQQVIEVFQRWVSAMCGSIILILFHRVSCSHCFDPLFCIPLRLLFKNFNTNLLPLSLMGTRPKLIVWFTTTEMKWNINQSAKQEWKDSYCFVDHKQESGSSWKRSGYFFTLFIERAIYTTCWILLSE